MKARCQSHVELYSDQTGWLSFYRINKVSLESALPNMAIDVSVRRSYTDEPRHLGDFSIASTLNESSTFILWRNMEVEQDTGNEPGGVEAIAGVIHSTPDISYDIPPTFGDIGNEKNNFQMQNSHK